MTSTMPQPSRFPARPLDVVWLLLYAALALAGPIRSTAAIEVLVGLAALQLIEPRLPWFTTREGTVALVMLKLFLAWLLIGVTDGIASSYYLILMVPVVAAATALGAVGTMLVSLLASVSYLSFLLFIDWESQNIQPDQMREIALRILLFCILAVLMYQLADASRAQARQYKETAGQLAEAYRNLEAAEAAVRRSERLAALGQLTAGLAHELRNPLGTMKASAEVLIKNLEPDQTIPLEVAGYIRDEVDRTSSLVTRFLDFARPLQLTRTDSDWNEMLDRAIGRLQNQQPPLPVAVSIIRNYSPDIRPFPFDADLMELVFYNLLLNAAQAGLPGCSPITITVKTRATQGGVEASVIDRGVGIDPAQRENIFNPFYTTKPTGTGLGLSTVAKIVGEHGGKIAVESAPGQGAIFRVLLPVTPA
jgi:two-component system, NtrC family, sensor histidine kinase HydH